MNSVEEKQLLNKIEAEFRDYPDFPRKGILFRDIMPVYGSPDTLEAMIKVTRNKIKDYQFDRVLGIESRGFLIGSILAHNLELPFTPIRKKGKLPGEVYSISYELEYGKDVLEIQKSGIPQNSRCLIVDDLIATGGSMEAASKLIKMNGSITVACLVIIELQALKGKDKLDTPLIKLFSY